MLVGIFLGPGSSLLWMGRGALYLIYVFLGLMAAIAFMVLVYFGNIPITLFTGIDPALAMALPVLPVAIVAFIHSLKIRGNSLRRPWYSRWYFALTILVFVNFGTAWFVRMFLYQPFSIPSASGIPNLMIGDHVFVSKYAYSPDRPPQLGDLAVFKLPSNTDVDYIQRVVGLPGDHLRMEDGVLNINGAPVTFEEVKLAPEFYQASELYRGELTFFRETLPSGRSYVIANSQNNGDADNTQEYVVPSGHYFVLGDNRDNAQDSRYDPVGYVPEENFTGPVVFRFWNNEGFSLTSRPEEISPVN